MEEYILKRAGEKHEDCITLEEIIMIIKNAGKKPMRRDTLYNIVK